jgi:hypothetical protein
MSLDERLRAGLEGLDALESAPPPRVVETVVARGRRQRWVRRTVAGAVALAAAISAVVVAPSAIDALSSDGERRPAVAGDRLGLITTVAGTGAPGLSGDGGPATAAEINYPVDLAFDGEGNLYILELGYGQLGYNVRVRRVDPMGRISTVAGPGARGDAGQLVLGTTFGSTGLAVDAGGTIYLGGGDGPDINNRVIRVDPSGDVTTMAGTGEPGSSGDGGPATEAKLAHVWDVAVDDEGNLYISADNRIRKVDTSGIITTIAGTGVPGFSGDGGLAVAAQLDSPLGIAVDPYGNIVFIDAQNQRIRRIDAQGVITTIVGNGEIGFSGDGGPATDARIHTPEHLWVDDEGNIYVADTYNRRVRKIDTDGIITTVAGNGTQAFSGDGGPATSAGLAKISGVAVGPDGALYIADSRHNRVRRVLP